MASVEKAIRDYLLTKSSVTALVGATGERLKPLVVDQEWRPTQGPFVTYEFVSTDEAQTLADRSGFVTSRLRITAYASEHIAANATARAIKNCGIATMKGVYSSVHICGVVIESGLRTDVEKPDDGTAKFRYLAEFDLMVSYLED